ncbi:MAG: YdeI/OmpD-associated family protein [Candidatus Kapaibacterium sp.]
MARIVPPDTEYYLLHGCGRCSLFDTPACKVHAWQQELRMLLEIVRAHDLQESIKWSVPCFTVDGANVLSVTAFKPHASINFFLGSRLSDPQGILVKPGENSQSARVFRCTDTGTIRMHEKHLHDLVEQSVIVARADAGSASSGTSAKRKASVPAVEAPPEFLEVIAKDTRLAESFAGLTPGRQRAYLMHFASAKQSATRSQRILKARPRILDGKGMHDE